MTKTSAPTNEIAMMAAAIASGPALPRRPRGREDPYAVRVMRQSAWMTLRRSPSFTTITGAMGACVRRHDGRDFSPPHRTHLLRRANGELAEVCAGGISQKAGALGEIVRDERKGKGASDHAPAWIVLK